MFQRKTTLMLRGQAQSTIVYGAGMCQGKTICHTMKVLMKLKVQDMTLAVYVGKGG